ncbi:yhhN-like family protein [Burkholderia pseudomallei MSHR1357]|nr:yhhN-like family protein [Burkholderia pseudomallei MSHR1357]
MLSHLPPRVRGLWLAAALAALLYGLSLGHAPYSGQPAAKAALGVLLLAAALRHPLARERAWLGAALAASTLGDVLLALASWPPSFVAGLGAFLARPSCLLRAVRAVARGAARGARRRARRGVARRSRALRGVPSSPRRARGARRRLCCRARRDGELCALRAHAGAAGRGRRARVRCVRRANRHRSFSRRVFRRRLFHLVSLCDRAIDDGIRCAAAQIKIIEAVPVSSTCRR